MLAALLLQAAVVSWSNLCGGTVVRVNDTLFDYTAPSTPPSGGQCRIIARNTSTGHADTSTAFVVAAGGTVPPLTGLPFCAPDLYTEAKANPAPFTCAVVGVTPSTILEVLAWAKQQRQRIPGFTVVLNTTAGRHQNFMNCGGTRTSCSPKDSLFSWAIWTTKMQGFATPAIQAAVHECSVGGWCILNVMDEPHVNSGNADDGAGVLTGATWGPPGTMTKVKLDQMCGYMQTLLAGSTAIVAHGYSVFEPTKKYAVCNGNISQWSDRLGPVATYLDGSVALAKAGGHAVLMAVNLRNGGKQDRDGNWTCDKASGYSGFKGQSAPNCEQTDAELLAAGKLILNSTADQVCGLSIWRYEKALVERHLAALQQLAALAATKRYRPCRRAA